jgi:hypothetical protein
MNSVQKEEGTPNYPASFTYNNKRGRRGRDRMVVRFTTTYASSAYHH